MKKKVLVTLTVIALLAMGSITAFAAAPDAPNPANPVQNCLYYGKATAMRGYNIVAGVLKNKFGVTDEEIGKAITSGETLYDVAKDKGVTDDQFKSAVIEERIKTIDQAVSDGTITKEQGDFMKERIKTNSSNMVPGQGRMGMKGGFGGRGAHGFYGQTAPNTNSATK